MEGYNNQSSQGDSEENTERIQTGIKTTGNNQESCYFNIEWQERESIYRKVHGNDFELVDQHNMINDKINYKQNLNEYQERNQR